MNVEKLCMSCMKELGDEARCPHCGFQNDIEQGPPYLPLKSVIADRYIVGRLIESGGDGATYMGFDTESETAVTIREYLPERYVKRFYGSTKIRPVEGEEEFYDYGRKEFLKLWRNLARNRNLGGLIPVLDIIDQNNTSYAISEYVETISLRDFLLKSRTGYLSWERFKAIVMPLLTTVSTLHSMGVYHLGISPNTLVLGRDGKLRLTGFMIADSRCRNTEFDSELFSGYAAIEQYSDIEDTGEWSDIYALGAVVYRALIGSIPSAATDRATNDKLMIPPKFAEMLPAYVVAAIEHALEIEPNDRPETIEQFRDELAGSPSAVESSRSRDAQPQPSATTEEEIKERRRLERLAIQEQNKQKQIKMTVISFAVVIVLGLIGIGIYFAVSNKSSAPEQNVTTDAVSEIIEVPNYVGESYSRIVNDDVQKTRFKFRVKYEYSTDVEAGYIISQSIEAGTQTEKGSEMELVVSNGAEILKLPNVVGKDYSSAEQTLTQAGFTVSRIRKPNDGTHESDIVYSMSPSAGSDYEKGKEVILQVWGEAPTETTTKQEETTTSKSGVDSLMDLAGG